jgi:hypothetical protein
VDPTAERRLSPLPSMLEGSTRADYSDPVGPTVSAESVANGTPPWWHGEDSTTTGMIGQHIQAMEAASRMMIIRLRRD